MVPAAPEAATECEVLQASKPHPQWARATDPIQQPGTPCGFAATLGRRCRVAHNSTGSTSVGLLSELEKVPRLGQSTSEQRDPRRRAMLDDLGNPRCCDNIAGHVMTPET